MVKRIILITLSAIFVLAALVLVPTIARISGLPEEIFLADGASQTIDIGMPLGTTVRSDSVGVLKLNGQSLEAEGGTYMLDKPIELSGEGEGETEISFEIMGVPVKSIKVTVGGERKLIPGGQSIGVMLYTNGALVVGGSDITTRDGKKVNPAREAGLRSGDVIEKVNGKTVEDAGNLRELVMMSEDTDIHLSVRRGQESLDITVRAVTDEQDGVQKLGVWVRDSTAGVGTLTFYDPNSGRFAGLGHAITDADTGQQLSVKDGEIIESKIIEIVRGAVGEPGELKGYFDPVGELLGHIYKNTSYGIYGDSEKPITGKLYTEGLSVASRDETICGPATIICTLDDSGASEYDVEIVKVNKQNSQESKSFVVKVTDPVLLQRTGGIVQGMSGSPVIQNGKLVGAVTHVFVNDPTQGYGIYVDWMLEELNW